MVTHMTNGSGMLEQWATSHIAGGNAEYVEALYEGYLQDPKGVSPEWRDYFDKLPLVQSDAGTLHDLPHSVLRERFARISKMRVRTDATVANDSHSTAYERKQVRVVQLISAYRQRGHQQAALDPLALTPRPTVPDLDLSFHELSEADIDTTFQVGSVYFGRPEATLAQIRDDLQRTYCGTVGAEFMHIVDTRRAALDYESNGSSARVHQSFTSGAAATTFFGRFNGAEGLERSLGSKYPGTKRFGLEGE